MPPSRFPRVPRPLGLGLLHLLLACGAGLVGGFPASEGLAQTETTQDWKRELQGLVEEATQAYGAGRYDQALVFLRKAETLAEENENTKFLASIRYNIARCFEQLGQKQRALEAYRAYDALPDLPHRKQKAFAAMQKLRSEVRGVLAVTCQQEGSSVLVPELSEAAQTCPFRSRAVEPGPYQVEVTAPGYKTSRRNVQVRPGATTALDFDLSPLPRPTERPRPSIAPAAEIAPSPSPGPSPWPWVTIGGGAALLATGGVFNALGASAANDANDAAPTPARDDLVSDFETNRDLAYVFYAVGGAVAAGGLVWLILDMTSGDDEVGQVGFRPSANGFEVRF